MSKILIMISGQTWPFKQSIPNQIWYAVHNHVWKTQVITQSELCLQFQITFANISSPKISWSCGIFTYALKSESTKIYCSKRSWFVKSSPKGFNYEKCSLMGEQNNMSLRIVTFFKLFSYIGSKVQIITNLENKKPYMNLTWFKTHRAIPHQYSILSIHSGVPKNPEGFHTLYKNVYLFSYTYPSSKTKFQNQFAYQNRKLSSR